MRARVAGSGIGIGVSPGTHGTCIPIVGMMAGWLSNSQECNQPSSLIAKARGFVVKLKINEFPGITPNPTEFLMSHSVGFPEQQSISHGGVLAGLGVMSAISGIGDGRNNSKPENPFDVPGLGS